jgi:DNA-directed RNA polymerase sigma subunit (sigma70/sigma32)
MLDRYMTDLQAFPLLTAREERALAQRIEALVLDHWRAVLSYRPALPIVEAQLQALFDRPVRALAALRGATPTADALKKVARSLQRLDKDAEGLKAVDRAVREALADEARAQRYLERVARARNAEYRAKGEFVAANLRLVLALA